MSKKVIIGDFGVFIDGISTEFLNQYCEKTGKNISKTDIWNDRDLYGTDPLIVEYCWNWAIDNFYKKGLSAPVSIVEIPDGYWLYYHLSDYDFGDDSEYITLLLDEEYFRNLLKIGTEDEIMEYVKQIGMQFGSSDDLIALYLWNNCLDEGGTRYDK